MEITKSIEEFLKTNPEVLDAMVKKIIYDKNPHEKLLDEISSCLKYENFNNEEKITEAFNKCYEGLNSFPNYSYEFLHKLYYIYNTIKEDFSKALFFNEFTLTALKPEMENYRDIVEGLFMDQYLIYRNLKEPEKALNAINNAILPGTKAIFLWIDKIELLIELNRYNQALHIINVCIKDLESHDDSFDRDFLQLYTLRKKIDEFYRNFNAVTEDNEKIKQYGG